MYRSILFAVVALLVMGCATTTMSKIDKFEGKGQRRGETEMATTFSSITLSISIRRSPGKVYEFASNPENMPKWAKGLGKSIKKQGTDWMVETPQGPMKVRFTEPNSFGVLDHFVNTASGVEVYVPMRVLSNGTGSEVTFTLFRLQNVSDEKYAEDMKMVEQDLQTLKNLLEK